MRICKQKHWWTGELKYFQSTVPALVCESEFRLVTSKGMGGKSRSPQLHSISVFLKVFNDSKGTLAPMPVILSNPISPRYLWSTYGWVTALTRWIYELWMYLLSHYETEKNFETLPIRPQGKRTIILTSLLKPRLPKQMVCLPESTVPNQAIWKYLSQAFPKGMLPCLIQMNQNPPL